MANGMGLKIRQLRRANKDTLKSLAEKIDYDYSNLSKVERGVYGVTPDMLEKIMEVYDVPFSYFFGNEKLVVDHVEVTEKELIDAIRLVRYFRDHS